MESLPPILSAALEESGRSLLARLDRIAAHSPSFERYTILGEIARGGMGRILRVWDNDLDRELAMKEIPSRTATDDEGSRADHERILARFIDEARITSQLGHPGIVPIHEIAVDAEGRLFFTMPLLRGETLAEVLEHVHREEGEWNRTRALHALLNVCMTMAFAHNEGVVHRDLKPSNIMVGKYGEVHVVDWGLALILGLTEQRRVVGTPAYMSPEQAEARAEDIGPRSDVYSLGAILYELLSGRMPHALSIEEQQGDYENVLGAAPRPVSKVVFGVPGELVAICEKAMSLAPEDRYESAGAMASDLRAFLEDRVVEAFDSSRRARLRKWRTRNRKLSYALEALVVVALLSIAALLYMQTSKLRTVQAKQQESDRNAYANDIRLAEMYLERGEIAEAKDALEHDYHAAERGWEREHLLLKLDSSLSTLVLDEERDDEFLASSPDATHFVTVSRDTELRLWDAETCTLVASLEGHDAPITCAAFAPGGEFLASGDEDNRVILWNVDEGRAVREFGRAEKNVSSVCFSRSGARLAWSEKGLIRVHDSRTGESVAEVLQPGDVEIGLLIAGADDQRFYSMDKGSTLRLWDVDEGTCLVTRQVGRNFSFPVADAIHRESTLAIGLPDEILLLDAATLETQGVLPLPDAYPRSLDFSDAGDLLVASTNFNAIVVWDVDARLRTSRQFGHDAKVGGVRFLPAGDRILSWSADGTMRSWLPSGGAELLLEEHEERIYCLTFSRDGRMIYSGSADMDIEVKSPKLRRWDGFTGQLLETTELPGVVDSITFHPTDGSFAYVANEGATSKPTAIRIRHPEDDSDRLLLHGHGRFVRTIAFDRQGEHLISRSDDGTVRIWRTSDGECLHLVEGLGEDYPSLALHPEKEWFAIGSGTGEVQIRRIVDGTVIRTLPWSGESHTLAFNSDGSLLAGGTLEGTIVIWSLTGAHKPRLLRDPASMIQSFAFHPHEPRIVSGSMQGTIRLWNVEREELLLTLSEDLNSVTALAFSPRGDRIASASNLGHLRIWRTPASLAEMLEK